MHDANPLRPVRGTLARHAGRLGRLARFARFARLARFGLALALAGCTVAPLREGRDLIGAGRVEDGLAMMAEATRADPRNIELRQAYHRDREVWAQQFLLRAEAARARGDMSEAEALLKRVERVDSEHDRLPAARARLAMDRRHAADLAEAEELIKKKDNASAEARLRTVLAENPGHRGARSALKRATEQQQRTESQQVLRVALNRPITLEFRDTPLRSIFEVMSRTTGLNFVFDRDVRQDLRTSIFVRNVSIDDVLKILLQTNQLDRKVMSENSLLVYPATQAKQREYQELVTRTFFLANADAKQILAMVKSVVKTRDAHIDEKLNLVILKDTPDAIRMAEQLIAAHDVAEPEVMLEVEVLEIASSKLLQLGVQWPDRVAYGVSGSLGSSSSSLTVVQRDTPLRFATTNPMFAATLKGTDGLANILANPRIRVRNREKAKIHIGEKVPVFTSTVTANVGTSNSVSYLDVGLKLDVEPLVHLDDDVDIKVNLEVSNILEPVQSPTGQASAYRLGTRNANTALRLHDGETQILAGLISDEDRRTASGIPGLAQMPLLGRLFGIGSDTASKTEIVLLMTPRIVRSLQRAADVAIEAPAGTEAGPGTPPLRLPTVRANSLSLTPSGGGSGPAPSAGGPSLPGGGAPFGLPGGGGSGLPGMGAAPIALPGMTPPAQNPPPRPQGSGPQSGLPGQPPGLGQPSSGPGPNPGANSRPSANAAPGPSGAPPSPGAPAAAAAPSSPPPGITFVPGTVPTLSTTQ